jgi:hypothetical protein
MDHAHEGQLLESETQQDGCAATHPPTQKILASPKRETFKHEPLPIDGRFIRLITIEPSLSQPDGLIQCSMLHTELNRAIYTCLSYRWGEPEPRKLILINGKQASIGTNLFDFLYSVRSKHQDAIWIDALCINQNDPMEKNHQVSQMGEIYSGARCVYVWLGLPTKRPTGCGSLLECVTNSIRHEYHHELWLCTNLFRNEYWKRCWIIQEIVLARHVVVLLGPDTSDFSQLVEAASRPKVYQSRGIIFYQRSYGYESSAFSQFSELNIGRSQFVAKGLIPLLADFSKTISTLTHDRIFALVPLCREKAIFEIDYTLSIRDLIYKTLTSCKGYLCACSTLRVLWSVLNSELGYPDDHLEISISGLRFTFEQGNERFQIHGDKTFAFRGRIAIMRQIKSVTLSDSRHKCASLSVLLTRLFVGTPIVRLHTNCPLNCGLNTIDDHPLNDLQSSTAMPIRSRTDNVTEPFDWSRIEVGKDYVLTDYFTMRSTSTGFLICISTSVLRSLIEGYRPLSHETNLRPMEMFVVLCDRGKGEKHDSFGSPEPFRFCRGPRVVCGTSTNSSPIAETSSYL